MGRAQPTKVEELDALNPGLRQLVDLMLDGFRTLEEIQGKVKAEFGEEIALSTISSYKQRRWLRHKQRVESIKEHAAAILELLEKHGVSEVRQAQLFERVSEAMSDGTKLDPHFMLKEERMWAEHSLRARQLEHEIHKLEAQHKQVAEIIAGAASPDGAKEFDPAEALRKISAVIGVGGELEERVEL